MNRAIWREYRRCDGEGLPPPSPSDVPRYSSELETVLMDVVDVYGRMSAWALSCESHLEQPWSDAYSLRSSTIPHDALCAHFKTKFEEGQVQLPVHLGGTASAALDFIPPARFASLHAMAETLRRLLRP